MPYADFIHLRAHSAYSLSEGAIPVTDLVNLSKQMKMPAVALTDTSNMFGVLEFSQFAVKAGIQPIIGCQLLVGKEPSVEKASTHSSGLHSLGPLILLAQNKLGYQNLLSLLHFAYMEPKNFEEAIVNIHEISKFSEGLLLLTGGANGPIGNLIQAYQKEEGEKLLCALTDAFPNRLYIEIQRHGLEKEKLCEPLFLEWALKYNVPIVATNECFFPSRDRYDAHDALLCIADGTYISETNRRRITPEHYFKSAEEMKVIFNDLPEAISNSIVIAQRTAFAVSESPPLLPSYNCGKDKDEASELKSQAFAGLQNRLKKKGALENLSGEAFNNKFQPYFDRLEHELKIINEMGYPGYFLIVADFIRWSKKQKIPVGPGRGSGAGSLVAWSLAITELDPLRWGLLFERFLNPERVSMPDFDIDFCQEKRDEVIRYVQEKYGRNRVAQIITFGKLQARAVLRDVGRVMQMPYGYVDKICKLIPNNPANQPMLQEAIEKEPQLRQLMAEDPNVQRQFDIAQQLEGLLRHASTHAAGVVIGDRPLEKLIPLYRDPRSDMPVSGFNMKSVESAGLIKFDFLGLKTLTVLSTTIELIKKNNININLDEIPLDHQATYKMISKGETTGVFQLESNGMRDVLRTMKPDTFEDIIAVVALYRPGPMDNIPSYIRRKHGSEELDYLHPSLEPILKETFGIIIYQEQVMQIAQKLSGYSLGNADLLRRAMGKKIQAEMSAQRKIFVDGAEGRGVDRKQASNIFDLVDRFAGYGFNKSHAAAYALLAYQTAYLKANYPIEFLAASMSLEINNTEKINIFRQELDRLNIPLFPPDINKSEVVFSVEKSGIRYALAALKNVGEGAMQKLVEEKKLNGFFQSISDFMARMDPQSLNKRQLESLVRAGVFDKLENNRLKLFNGIEQILHSANIAYADRNSNQEKLFGNEEVQPKVTLVNEKDWSPVERLKQEFESIGFYLSAHPLDPYSKNLARLQVLTSAEIIASRKTSSSVKLAGTLIGKKERTSAKGNKFAFLNFTDTAGNFEVTCFAEILNELREKLVIGTSFIIRAGVVFEGDVARFTANKIEPLEKVASTFDLNLKIWIDQPCPLQALHEILHREGKGNGLVTIVTKIANRNEVEINLGESFRVSPELLLAIKTIPGVLDAQEI
ncbi:MAG: DNA polymerase III subunit alpha [Alphaproteobacteria bacterium MarineAlpha3_Bin5]|nr:MAG: DNA polymerase III subunit alpha [Alphaproteobacteria bacterium MarineAlpha3_Bin5]